MNTLILLHGWGADGRVWRHQAAAFGARLQVLTPTLAAWEAGWLADYLGHLDLPSAALVGWSLGGMLLLEALPRLPASPGRLLLVGAAAAFCARPDFPAGQPAAAVRAMRRGLGRDPEAVLRDFARRCLAPGEAEFLPEAAGYFPPADTAYLAAGLDYLLHQDFRKRLQEVPGAPVIVHGTDDLIVAPAQARFLQEQIPGARLRLLEGAGHLPFLTQAAAFNEILEELV